VVHLQSGVLLKRLNFFMVALLGHHGMLRNWLLARFERGLLRIMSFLGARSLGRTMGFRDLYLRQAIIAQNLPDDSRADLICTRRKTQQVTRETLPEKQVLLAASSYGCEIGAKAIGLK